MKLFPYLDEQLIFLIDSMTKEDALHKLVMATVQIKEIPSSQRFYESIMQREKIVSTGIGMGVAIPHAKLSSYDDFFIAIGILQKSVDWNALDGAPVRLIFLIGGPDDKQTEYLKILSALTVALRDEELRKQLLLASDAKEVLALFTNL